MNNDLNKNTRTLVVSLVLALMVMVPLRFVEIGQMSTTDVSEVQVLGDSTELVEIDTECLSPEFVDQVVSFLDPENEAVDIDSFELRRCQ